MTDRTAGREALAEVLQGLRQLDTGADPAVVADAVWPAFQEAVGRAVAGAKADELAGVQRWQQERHQERHYGA